MHRSAFGCAIKRDGWAAPKLWTTTAPKSSRPPTPRSFDLSLESNSDQDISLTVPAALDTSQVEQIEIAERLLRGLAVRGTWSVADLNDDEQMRRLLNESEHGVQMQFVRAYELRLADQSIPIGDVQYTLAQVHLSTTDEGVGPIKVVAGDRNDLVMRLRTVERRTNADGSTSWVPPSMLQPYEGQWVAQSGTTILLHAQTRDEVVSGLRASGLRGTIWRIPPSSSVTGASLP